VGLFWVDTGQQSEKVPESGVHYLSVCLSVSPALCHSVSVSVCLSTRLSDLGAEVSQITSNLSTCRGQTDK